MNTVKRNLSTENLWVNQSEQPEGNGRLRITGYAGASLDHNEILAYVFWEIYSHLKGKPCRAYPSDLKVTLPKPNKKNSYCYPDLTVVCNPQFMFGTKIVENPKMIIEVLSPGTREYDLKKKFELYKNIATLEEYVVIDSTEIFVRSSIKNPKGIWDSSETTDINNFLKLQSIGHNISLVNVYMNTLAQSRP